MTLSMHQASVAAFAHNLTAFSAVLDKAAAYAEKAKFEPSVYMTLRLRPDMFAFPRQVQSFCDQAKNGSARLAGVEPPRFADDEATLADLKGRIAKTAEFLGSLDAAAIEASADREILFPIGPMKAKMLGSNYLLHWVLPNHYFHLTTAYGLLREAGVDLGKRDFMGQPPGLTLL